MRISVQADVAGATRYLGALSNQIPYATSRAINDTMVRVKDAEMTEIVNKVDRPTPFTVEAYQMSKMANKQRLWREIALRDNRKYLAGLITGGSESKKHQVIGKRAPANAYGNLERRATKASNTFSATIKGQPGVWKRTGDKGNRSIHLVAHFPGSRSYSKMLDFYGVAERTTRLHFQSYMRLWVASAIRTAR